MTLPNHNFLLYSLDGPIHWERFCQNPHLRTVPGIVKPTVPRMLKEGSDLLSTRRHASTGEVSVRPQPFSTGKSIISKKSSRCGASEAPPLMIARFTPSSYIIGAGSVVNETSKLNKMIVGLQLMGSNCWAPKPVKIQLQLLGSNNRLSLKLRQKRPYVTPARHRHWWGWNDS